MAEPEVHFERATEQVKVTVEQQEPQINVQRAGSPQGQQLARAGQQLPGGEQQALQQIDQAVRQARHSLERDEAKGAGEALDQAGSTIQQAIEQASAEARQQLQQVEQRVAEAQQALGKNDLESARKALEHTQEPLRQMTEAAGGRAQQTQAAGEQQIQREAEQQDAKAKPEEEVTTPKQLPAKTQNPLAAMPASEVIDAEVNNLEGDNVAKIADLVKQQGRDEIYAVLSVGGLLGIGDKKVVVPLDELQVGQEGTIVMANASEERLKQMAEYDEKRYESTAGLGERPQQQ
jgi:hypothetical protein